MKETKTKEDIKNENENENEIKDIESEPLPIMNEKLSQLNELKEMERKYYEFWDLRSRAHCINKKEKDKDCVELLCHPAVVISIFILGLLLIGWGFWCMYEYMVGKTVSLTKLWWQTTIVMLFITLLNIILPFRFRFGSTLYCVLIVLLLLQYGGFIIAFPIQYPSETQIQNMIHHHVEQKLNNVG